MEKGGERKQITQCFGVVAVITMEAGLITPPIGLNVFVISGMVKDVPLYGIFRSAILFLVAMAITVAILVIFLEGALFLPKLMM